APAGKAQGAVQKRYRAHSVLGRGGFSSVYAGTRLMDGIPVRVPEPWHGISPWHGTDGIVVLPQPNSTRVPLEVVLLDKVSSGCHGVIQLLEWFELPNYICMVMERP
ncbi:PIM1 kinase, partial [Atrichornis clamosus]|nr:PIM1 kinase [Atrichornis clamosus]